MATSQISRKFPSRRFPLYESALTSRERFIIKGFTLLIIGLFIVAGAALQKMEIWVI